MNADCRRFDLLWNAALDARGAADAGDLERALEAHEAACPRCRAAAEGYRRLRRAIGALPPLQPPPADLVDRVLAAHEAGPGRARWDRVARPLRWAAAAAVLLAAAGIGARVWRGPAGAPPTVVRGPVAPAVAPRPLADALADATAATLDLARTTSAPAARVGRQVLASAVQETEPPSLSGPWPESADPGVLKSVADGLQQGVGPLSGSARRAFGFLLGPASARTPAAPPDRGA
jgi:hypothetical protein